jgi:signal recognition particle subunit SRP19
MVMLMDEVIIWPSFIDANLTRSEGRRLPRKACVKSPEVNEMLKAAERLGVEARVEKKAYPRRWHVEKKALVLGEKQPRADFLQRLSREVRQSRTE